jgi:hypothetical protein
MVMAVSQSMVKLADHKLLISFSLSRDLENKTSNKTDHLRSSALIWKPLPIMSDIAFFPAFENTDPPEVTFLGRPNTDIVFPHPGVQFREAARRAGGSPWDNQPTPGATSEGHPHERRDSRKTPSLPCRTRSVPNAAA